MWDMANRKRGNDIAESTTERAQKRLKLSTPTRTGDRFYLPGLREFDDAYDGYYLWTDGKGDWKCSCHGHYGGELREERVCTHSAAVALFFGLPCLRTLPLKEAPTQSEIESKEPERRTPERPCDIPGIPDSYPSWRPGQRETVDWVVERWINDGEYSTVDAPTGSGKSVIAITAVKIIGGKAIVFVVTKPLQMQYRDCFPDAKIIWGREMYKCIRFSGTELTAADCTHRKHSPCPKIGDCPYKQAEREAQAADLVVTNYSYGLHKMNYTPGFPNHRTHIWDEGDQAGGEILKFVSLTLTQHQLEQCEIKPPEYKTKLDAWLEWARPTSEKVKGHLGELETRLEPLLEAEQEPPKSLMFELLHYQRLEAKLKMFTDLVDETWVAELDNPERWEFKPTWVRRFGYLLTKHADRILAMSATMLSARDWAYDLGIGEENGRNS